MVILFALLALSAFANESNQTRSNPNCFDMHLLLHGRSRFFKSELTRFDSSVSYDRSILAPRIYKDRKFGFYVYRPRNPQVFTNEQIVQSIHEERQARRFGNHIRNEYGGQVLLMPLYDNNFPTPAFDGILFNNSGSPIANLSLKARKKIEVTDIANTIQRMAQFQNKPSLWFYALRSHIGKLPAGNVDTHFEELLYVYGIYDSTPRNVTLVYETDGEIPTLETLNSPEMQNALGQCRSKSLRIYFMQNNQISAVQTQNGVLTQLPIRDQ